jgi:hypothetical protein
MCQFITKGREIAGYTLTQAIPDSSLGLGNPPSSQRYYVSVIPGKCGDTALSCANTSFYYKLLVQCSLILLQSDTVWYEIPKSFLTPYSQVVISRTIRFNIQNSYFLPRKYLCLLYEYQKQLLLFPCTPNHWFLEPGRSVNCAVRSQYLDKLRLISVVKWLNKP